MFSRAAFKGIVPVLAITAVLALAFVAPSRNNPFNTLLGSSCPYGYPSVTPTVTGVTPNTGSTSGGTTVSITGTGFCGVTGVGFGSTAATSFQAQSNTLISAVAPAHAAGMVDVRVTTSSGTSAITPADQFTYISVKPMSACSTGQYTFSSSDGTTWGVIDGTYLSITFTPGADSYAIIGGNGDLWTANAGINQDLGIGVGGGAYPTTAGQPEAWKESGGSGGTFSPNAAFVQTVIPVASGTTYTAKLVWKANQPNTGTIYAGAGPVGGKFSPTCINVRLVLQSSASLVSKVSTAQYTLTGNDGSTWQDIDPTGLSLSFSPTTAGVLLATGNADLWTNAPGFNQDLGISVAGGSAYPSVSGQPEAWKESGGGAGTFSPNAAYVQTVLPVNSALGYTVKLQWKTNQADPNTIYAGAGNSPKFSPTRLTVLFLPTGIGTAPVDKVSTLQYSASNSDGKGWAAIDFGKLILTYTPTNDCEVIVSVNVDLWTSTAGVNQDIGIGTANPTVPGQPEAWKESGGKNGTFSPNAAFLQMSQILSANQTYTFQVVWKANQPTSGTIWAGAGPIGGKFSPTRLTLQPVGC
jgi:hypothetical protein